MNPTIRGDLEGVIEPLKKTGIDEFALTTPNEPPVTVSKAEAPFFNAPVGDEQIIYDETTVQVVDLRAPDFTVGNKWKFVLVGVGTIWATILDQEYLAKVQRHEETFGAGDLLRVRLHTVISRQSTGVPERVDEIVRVMEKIPPPDQQSLFP